MTLSFALCRTQGVGKELTDDLTPPGGVNVVVDRDRDGKSDQPAAMQPHPQQATATVLHLTIPCLAQH